MRREITGCIICAMIIGAILMIEVPEGVSAQITEEWVARYNSPGNYSDRATDIAVDSSGNVYVIGGCVHPTWDESDYITIKYDSSGNELWVRRYNGPGNEHDIAFDLVLDSYENVIVTGRSHNGTTDLDYTTIKYDPLGNELWIAKYNSPDNYDDQAFAIAIDSSDNVYVTGKSNRYFYFPGGFHSHYDYTTVAYDSLGNELWVARYNGPIDDGWDEATAIAVDDLSGDIYVTGQSEGNGTKYDYATIKYDASGNELWAARYNGPGNYVDLAKSLIIDASGNVFVTGRSDGGSTNYDYATIKYDPLGNEMWVQRYNGPGDGSDRAYSIALDSLGNIFVTGGSDGGVTNQDFATLKYDSDGNELWVARYEGPGNSSEWTQDIAIDSLNNIYVTGYSGINPNYDITTLKYDSSGNQLWIATYNGPGNDWDMGRALYVDVSGNVYVTGYSTGIGTEHDMTTIKYSYQEPKPEPTIDIDPDTLNLKSKGRWITAYITLNSPYEVDDIDISTVILEDTVQAEWGDIQNDTLMVKFDRSEAEDMLSPGTYNLKVTGKLTDGTEFEGYSDEMRVIEPP
ncbi:MAG: SBBP repeat-containing protein [Thermoplasmata archaeon]|nr:MAG: SBBP repeat-containing protein [Thermoplasmata archaeon]